jgi:hypothetical protein
MLMKKIICTLALLTLPSLLWAAHPEIHIPKKLPKQLSADGKTLLQGSSVRVLIADPNPAAVPLKIPAPITLKTAAATATFNITYVPAGGEDLWGESCSNFPEEAKAAFEAAAKIWGNILRSSVPITIRACWADLGDSGTLGYSGAAPLHRNFSKAPQADTWYDAALANALAGSDLNTKYVDMHITYNRNFAWYYGTDGQTATSQYDLMTVVLHEIAHGLNFSGSMDYEEGRGYWGYSDDLKPLVPNIYDRFVRDGFGKNLTDYSNGSFALGSALTSGNLWFHGPQALAANGGQPVRIYAPASWIPASSYAHLDYNTFKGTLNQLMLYAISAGTAIHDPGPVTKGILEDMGWDIFNLPKIFNPLPHNDGRVSSFERSSQTLQVQVHDADSCTFSYSTDGTNFFSKTGNLVNTTCTLTLNYGEDLISEGKNFWYVEAENDNGSLRYPTSGFLVFTSVNKRLSPALRPILQLLLE